jgi:hypothetical protein
MQPELVVKQIEGGEVEDFELFVSRFPQAIYEFRSPNSDAVDSVVKLDAILLPGGRVAEVESVDAFSVTVRLFDTDGEDPSSVVTYQDGGLYTIVGGESSPVEPGSEGIQVGLVISSTLQRVKFNRLPE